MAATAHPARRGLLPALQAIGLGFIVLFLAVYARSNVGLQWDLHVYLAAARAALAGLDPYDVAHLKSASAPAHPLPWIYPPVALLPFAALQALPHAAAAWFGLKLGLLAGLIALWKRWFVPGTPVLIVAMMAFFASNGAGLMDLRAGNVATIEAACVWVGLTCFVRGHRRWFAACIVLAACFKLIPAAFLLLLLVPAGDARPDMRTFGLAWLALLVLVAAPFAVEPVSGWTPFAHDRSALITGGEANPSAPALLGEWLARLGVALPGGGQTAYVLYAILLLGLSAGHLRRLAATRDAPGWVMAGVFLYLLLAPRPMLYGWVMLGVAPFIRAPRPFDTPAGRALLAALLTLQGVLRALHAPLTGPVMDHAPFLIALALWLLVLLQSRGGAAGVRPASAPTAA